MDRKQGKKRGLNLPAGLVNTIEGGSFSNDDWQKAHNMAGGKRKSRKETRRELRQNKRLKRMPATNRETRSPADRSHAPQNSNTNAKGLKPAKATKQEPPSKKKKDASDKVVKPPVSAHELEMRKKDEEDAKYYAKKLGLKSMKLKGGDDGMDDFLGDLDVESFSASHDEDSQAGIESGSESGSDSDSDSDSGSSNGEMTAAETMAKLAALKAKKNENTEGSKKDPGLRIVKEDELGVSDDSFDDEEGFGSDSSAGDMTAEETMAKLAAVKAAKSGASSEQQKRSVHFEEDDSVGSSDFDSQEDNTDGSDGESMTAEETMAKLAALKGKKIENAQPGLDDDSLSESDLDEESDDEDDTEMTADETMKKLAALKNKKISNASEGEQESDFDSDSDSDSDSDENPYLPPSRRMQEDPTRGKHDTAQSATHTESEAVVKMRRVFKSALNRLTETTFNPVVNEIELAFSRNSRAEASGVLTQQILEIVSGSQPLQHGLFVVYGGVVAALYRSVGTSFAALFIQKLVEDIMKGSESANNYLMLLVECYALHVVSSRLLYDIVKGLLQKVTSAQQESTVEQILVIVRSGGSLLRADDPLALKEVIIILQQRVAAIGGNEALPPRMRFLVDTIVALKNNRQKPVSELVMALRQRIRKTLQSSSGGRAIEALQVGLSDIQNSESKGKWWLVGASWKGNESRNGNGGEVDPLSHIVEDDSLGGAAPDWLELAKKQRLNTDVRRAVFVALMGAEDYLDACLRIDKLGLKNKQERDIPHVILHCLSQESVYNPYYALVAAKQCTRHSTKKTFQFRLFDWIDSESVGNTQVAMHYGRFYASLVVQKVLGLEILKAVDFLGLSGDARVFVEIFFVTLYRDLGKQAEKDAKRHFQQGIAHVDGKVDRDGRELTLLLSKCKEEKVLRGIQLVTRMIISSEAIRNERERERVLWCAELASDMVDELVKRGGVENAL